MLTSLLPTTERALLRRLAVEQREGRVPSLIAGLVRDGRTIWVGTRGRVGDAAPTSNTQYRVGSITKTFIAVLVMRLRDEGRLDLADKLDDHVPGTSIGNRSITELLTHSSGLTATTRSTGRTTPRRCARGWSASPTSPRPRRAWASTRTRSATGCGRWPRSSRWNWTTRTPGSP